MRPVRAMLAALWRLLSGVGGVLLALVLLFEEWGWRPLAELLGWLVRFRIWARCEAFIASLPPYPALVAFALPSLLLAPVKLGALWLLAAGRPLLAALLLIAAKLAGTALVARIFLLTRPSLMQLAWFARLYGLLMPWKEAIYARLRASSAWRYGRLLKSWLRHQGLQAWPRWRPQLLAWRRHLAAALLRLRLRAVLAWRQLRARLGR